MANLTEQDIEVYARTGLYAARMSSAAFRRAIADLALRGMRDGKDAERYRWLRLLRPENHPCVYMEALDAALDADAERRGSE